MVYGCQVSRSASLKIISPFSMHSKTKLRSIFVATWSAITFACFFVVLPIVGNDQSFSTALSAKWPTSTELAKVTTSGHLIVFVHPYCPCTRATLKNLDVALDSIELHVSIVQLRTERLESIHSPISSIASLANKNNWNLIMDNEGVEAKRFGATTSGECLLFDAEGSLLFAGGITAGRGHLGNNEGLETLKELTRRLSTPSDYHSSSHEKSQFAGTSPLAQFPTFGCPLSSETGCGRQLNACPQYVN